MSVQTLHPIAPGAKSYCLESWFEEIHLFQPPLIYFLNALIPEDPNAKGKTIQSVYVRSSGSKHRNVKEPHICFSLTTHDFGGLGKNY